MCFKLYELVTSSYIMLQVPSKGKVTRLESHRVGNHSSHRATLKSNMQKLGLMDFASSHFESRTCST